MMPRDPQVLGEFGQAQSAVGKKPFLSHGEVDQLSQAGADETDERNRMERRLKAFRGHGVQIRMLNIATWWLVLQR